MSFTMTPGARLSAGAALQRSTRFWDRIAERYARKPVPDEAVYQEKLKVTREYFRADTDVLEIGCGTGSTAILRSSPAIVETASSMRLMSTPAWAESEPASAYDPDDAKQ